MPWQFFLWKTPLTLRMPAHRPSYTIVLPFFIHCLLQKAAVQMHSGQSLKPVYFFALAFSSSSSFSRGVTYTVV